MLICRSNLISQGRIVTAMHVCCMCAINVNIVIIVIVAMQIIFLFDIKHNVASSELQLWDAWLGDRRM